MTGLLIIWNNKACAQVPGKINLNGPVYKFFSCITVHIKFTVKKWVTVLEFRISVRIWNDFWVLKSVTRVLTKKKNQNHTKKREAVVWRNLVLWISLWLLQIIIQSQISANIQILGYVPAVCWTLLLWTGQWEEGRSSLPWTGQCSL